MGLSDWYPFIRRKGYDPALLYHSIIPTITTGQRRLDVLGTCFRAINYAYSNHPQEIANNMLQKDIERFGDKLTMVLYIDGPQAEEKKWTAQVRESGREKAQGRVKASLDTFESRIDSSLRIRKQHFIDIKKGLGSSFYWCLESREHFAEHMRGLGWDVRICTTEADVAIAQDAQPKDIIISCDSDMLGYASIVTLWRPVSKSLILVYYLPELLKTIGLSRTQLTALAVVSRNDYQRNISSLGPATNYGIVRAIGDRPANSQVTTKNTYQETFANSLRVFVECQQTQIEPVVLQPSSQANYETLQKRFKDLCGRRDSLKEAQAQGARSRQDSKVRLRIPRSFNRYRTVESPGYVSKNAPALAPESHSTPAPATQSTPSQDIAHPPLQRTGFPRNRGRFSFKERTRKKVHNPPPKMKQFHQKPYKEPPPLPIKLPREKKSKEEEEETAPSVTKRTTKQGLVRSMAWYHPTTTLEVGTLSANTKRVFFTAPTSTSSSATFSSTIPPSTPPTLTSASTLSTSTAQISTTPNSDQHVLQQEVVTSLQEASRLAAGVKRTSQRLIGQFVDTLRVKMDAAEEGLRAKLLSGKATDTEKEQSKNWIKCRSNALSKDERLVLSYLCVPVKPKDDGVDENDSAVKRVQNNSDIDDKDGSEQLRFLTSFLTYLYSGNYPYVRGASVEAILNKGTGIVPTVNTFIDWLIAGEFYKPPRRRGEINVSMPFTPGYLVRSVSGQLAAELRRMYSNGSHDLYKKVEAMKDRGTLGADIDIRIQDDVSAVENFLYLNKLTLARSSPLPLRDSPSSPSQRESLPHFFGSVIH
ncbi:hypothetical protein BGX30_005524 [Mortierella sp. GBA39]|nr:hypothetical protein BGX30_005524 [Mortierella sp. GBA39]